MRNRHISLTIVIVMLLLLTLPSVAMAFDTQSMRLFFSSDHFRLYGRGLPTEQMEEIQGLLTPIYNGVTGILGLRPTSPTSIYVYPSREEAQTADGYSQYDGFGDGSFGCCIGDSMLLYYSAQSTVYEKQYLTAHELTHATMNSYVHNSPSYLNEGLAHYVQDKLYTSDQDRHGRKTITDDLLAGTCPAVTELSSLPYGDPTMSSLVSPLYVYGEAFVDFIAETFGLDKVFELMNNKPRSEVLGLTDEELNVQWMRHLENTYRDSPGLFDTDSMQLFASTEHFRLYGRGRSAEQLEEISQLLDPVYDNVTGMLGMYPAAVTSVYLYPSREEAQTADGYSKYDGFDDGTFGGVIGDNLLLFFSSKSTQYDKQYLIAHEFTHIVTWDHIQNIPSYLSEGIAHYVQDKLYVTDEEQHDRQTVTNDLKDGTCPAVTELSSLTYTDTTMSSLVAPLYVYGEAFVDFIAETFGLEKVFELMADKPCSDVLGLTDAELNARWMAFLQSTYGEKEEPAAMPSPSAVPSAATADDVLELFTDPSGTYLLGIRPGRVLRWIENRLPAGWTLSDASSADTVLNTGRAVVLKNTDEMPVAVTVVVTGDVLGNGSFSLIQVIRMARALRGADPLLGAFQLAGDLNASGGIDLSDLVTAANWLLNGVPTD